MSEFGPPSLKHPEHRSSPERHELLALPDEQHAEKLRPGEKPPKHAAEIAQELAEARKTIENTESTQTPLDQLKQLEQAENTPQMATPRNIDSNLRRVALHREMKNVQRKLPTADRLLSKVIHQPVVRVLSEATGKTLSRPSGLLGGGLVALLGTSIYLYTARHIGFQYNYVVFLMLFAGGFIIGLALELLVWVATSSRRKSV